MFDVGVKSVCLVRINPISPLHLSFPVQNYGKISVKKKAKSFLPSENDKIEYQSILRSKLQEQKRSCCNFDSCVMFLVTKNNNNKIQRALLYSFHRICLYVGNYASCGILFCYLFHANMSNYFKKKQNKPTNQTNKQKTRRINMWCRYQDVSFKYC